MSVRFSSKFNGRKSGMLETSLPSVRLNNCVNLASADLFYPQRTLPQSVQKAIEDHLNDPCVAHYGDRLGNRQLRETIALRLQQRYGASLDPGANILITSGSEIGLLAAAQLFLEEGDEALIPDPSYPTNFSYVRYAGGKAVSVPLDEQNGFPLSLESFESRLTANTKAVFLTHPNNPTGTVYSRTDLEALCAFIVKHNLVLVCDMAFEDYVYDDFDFVWPAMLPGMWERTITLFTASKGFGLCGLRVGYIVSDASIMDTLLTMEIPLMYSTNTLAQFGFTAALKDKELVEDYRNRLIQRRDKTIEMISQIPNISVSMPQGGIQCWVNVSSLGSSAEICRYLREKAGVLVSNGASFGPINGEGHIRVVFGCEDDDLRFEAALARVCDALCQHPKNKH